MLKPKIPPKENERLEALKKYDILDSANEQIFDGITKLAASICNLPISLISLVDENRQWFKSRVGLIATQTPRDISFCGHAINQNEIFYVEDARKDDRFSDNPLVTGDPNIVFYAGQSLIDKNGNCLGTLCVIDHTPRKLSNTQLDQLKTLGELVIHLIQSRLEIKEKEESHSLLVKISNNLPGCIYTYQEKTDGSKCFPYASSAIKEIYEVTPEEVKKDATTVFNRIAPDDLFQVKSAIEFSQKNMTKWNCDYQVILPTLGKRWLRGSSTPEKEENGNILWHGFIYDITELKNQEALVAHSSKMASLGEMASGIAHEINNPLSIIQANTTLLIEKMESVVVSPEIIIQTLSKIQSTSERINKIIKGLRTISRDAINDKFELTSMQKLLDEVLSLSEQKIKRKEIKLTTNIPKEDILVECSETQIFQILINLINNSCDAISGQSNKWINIDMILINNSNSLQCSITDSGNGIPKEIVNKLMQPFFTTKEVGHGTGLGLSISRKIIENHKGHFYLNESSQNTCFVFDIPLKNTREIK